MASPALPRITIVTPSYQQAAFLERTLLSVAGQGYPELEYIVIDGGSTDGSAELIARHADALAYWCSERDRGQADAINKGMARATGEIMGWVNSDDMLMPGALARVAEAMRDPRVEAVCGWRVIVDAEDRHLGDYAYPAPTREVLLRRAILPQETVFWRRSVWDRLGPLDASLRFTLDFDYWVRMALAGIVPRLIRSYQGVFRWHGEQKSQAMADVGRAEVLGVLQKAWADQDIDPDQLRKQLPRGWKWRMRALRKLAYWGILGSGWPKRGAPEGKRPW